MVRNLLNATLLIVTAASPLSICFKSTRKSMLQRDPTFVATATRSSWGPRHWQRIWRSIVRQQAIHHMCRVDSPITTLTFLLKSMEATVQCLRRILIDIINSRPSTKTECIRNSNILPRRTSIQTTRSRPGSMDPHLTRISESWSSKTNQIFPSHNTSWTFPQQMSFSLTTTCFSRAQRRQSQSTQLVKEEASSRKIQSRKLILFKGQQVPRKSQAETFAIWVIWAHWTSAVATSGGRWAQVLTTGAR
jgi:hypothetical protein